MNWLSLIGYTIAVAAIGAVIGWELHLHALMSNPEIRAAIRNIMRRRAS
jgi:hypothetical protein